MTTHAATTGHAALASAGSPLSAWFKTLATKLDNWWIWHRSYRQTVKELSRLSDRELGDIGIARYDIQRLAFDHASSSLDATPARR